MPINIKQLEEIYSTSNDSPANQGWIAIPDSKGDTLIANAVGSSGGNPGNGWKIHISIDPDKISQAALLIAQELNRDDAPRVSIKLAGKQLAGAGQPSKQAAFIFYEDELNNKTKIAAFINRIEYLLSSNDIGIDPRPINSDIEAAKAKYDAVIVDDQGQPTRFNYRNESCIVMQDDVYNDVGGTGNISVQGEQIWVKQSYYLQLPDSQKHNPGNCVEDPLAEFQNVSPKSEQTQSQTTMNINMMVLSGFIAALGIAAVAIAFTVLNAATFGVAGLVVAGIGIAATFSSVGLFATSAYKQSAITEEDSLEDLSDKSMLNNL